MWRMATHYVTGLVARLNHVTANTKCVMCDRPILERHDMSTRRKSRGDGMCVVGRSNGWACGRVIRQVGVRAGGAWRKVCVVVVVVGVLCGDVDGECVSLECAMGIRMCGPCEIVRHRLALRGCPHIVADALRARAWCVLVCCGQLW